MGDPWLACHIVQWKLHGLPPPVSPVLFFVVGARCLSADRTWDSRVDQQGFEPPPAVCQRWQDQRYTNWAIGSPPPSPVVVLLLVSGGGSFSPWWYWTRAMSKYTRHGTLLLCSIFALMHWRYLHSQCRRPTTAEQLTVLSNCPIDTACHCFISSSVCLLACNNASQSKKHANLRKRIKYRSCSGIKKTLTRGLLLVVLRSVILWDGTSGIPRSFWHALLRSLVAASILSVVTWHRVGVLVAQLVGCRFLTALTGCPWWFDSLLVREQASRPLAPLTGNGLGQKTHFEQSCQAIDSNVLDAAASDSWWIQWVFLFGLWLRFLGCFGAFLLFASFPLAKRKSGWEICGSCYMENQTIFHMFCFNFCRQNDDRMIAESSQKCTKESWEDRRIHFLWLRKKELCLTLIGEEYCVLSLNDDSESNVLESNVLKGIQNWSC